MIAPFPHRLIAAVFQSAVVLFEHLPPLVAAAVFFAAVVAVVAVSVAVPWQTARLVVHVWRWVCRRTADREALAELNREYAELCAGFRPGRDSPATPPPVRRPSRRRRVRHTTSSSDRRTRS